MENSTIGSGRLVNLGSIDQVPLGEGRVFSIGGENVAVFRDRTGGIFASQSTCPHLSGPLSDGMLGNGIIVCPLHDRAFNLITGESLNSESCIKVYSVAVNQFGNMEINWVAN